MVTKDPDAAAMSTRASTSPESPSISVMRPTDEPTQALPDRRSTRAGGDPSPARATEATATHTTAAVAAAARRRADDLAICLRRL